MNKMNLPAPFGPTPLKDRKRSKITDTVDSADKIKLTKEKKRPLTETDSSSEESELESDEESNPKKNATCTH